MKDDKPIITRVIQVTLKVSNLEEMTSFYQRHIGLRTNQIRQDAVGLSADGERDLLVLERIDESIPPPPDATGLYHIALLLPSRTALADQLIHFRKMGTKLQGASDHHVSEAVYLSDPEGNGIELYADREGIAPGDMGTDQLPIQDVLKEASGKPWQGLPPNTVVGHVHLKVNDLDKTAAFYRDILGFDLIMQMGHSAVFLSTGGYHHHIALNTWESADGLPPPRNSTGLKQISLAADDDCWTEEVKNKLDLNGISATERTSGLYVTDPSGNGIHLLGLKK